MITVEYIWLDGAEDMPQIRSKTRVFKEKHGLHQLPEWSFDGGSTWQGTLRDSDRILKPVKLYKNPFSEGNYLALCEVMNTNGKPHQSNHRHQLVKDNDPDVWFGFEQEYTLTDPMQKPLVPAEIEQGEFYCGNGTGRVMGRGVSLDHLKHCDKAGIRLFGANAEVMLSQWEYQTNPVNAVDAADDLWVTRYLLERGAEFYNLRISYHPKIYTELNGAGCHVNISTPSTREDYNNIKPIMAKFREFHDLHMEVYGIGNVLRLTGEHETSSYDEFTWNVGDRGASVRIPSSVKKEGKGYFEDRRPAATCDPYRVTARILETLR